MNDSLEPAATVADTDSDTAGMPVAVKRRKAPIFLASAAAVALVISVAAFAGYNLVFGGPQPAERMPASAVAYLSVDLSPGLDQTRKLAQLSRKLPQTGRAGNPKAGLEKALHDDLDLQGVDVQRDLTAWLGNRVAVAAWADAHHQVYGLLALQSTDDKAATEGLTRIKAAAKAEFGFTVRDGYALAAFGGKDAQAAADAAAAEAAASPLAESAAYAEARKWLDDDQFAVFYADYDAASKIMEPLNAAAMGSVPAEMPSGTVVLGVRAEDDGLSARYRSFGGKAQPAAPSTDALAKLGALPAGSAIGLVARLPEDAGKSPLSFGLPFLLASGAGDITVGEPKSPLTPAEETEFETLIDKQMSGGKLTKAEQKRLDQLNTKMMGSFAPPKNLTKAEQAELEALMAKENPSEADDKRIAELLGVPGLGSDGGGFLGVDKESQQMFDALSGGLLSVAVSDVTGAAPAFRAIVELAKTPDAAAAQKWTEMSGKDVTVKLDGATLTLQSDGYGGTGRLADDPLFRRASVGTAAAGAQMAVYVDLTRAVPDKDRAELGSVQAVFLSGSADSGTVRVLIG